MRTIIFLILTATVTLHGQEANFRATSSTDSVLLGNYFEVTFTLKDLNGSQFQPPSFEDFEIVGGPNQTSSFSMVNGTITQHVSYAYYLQPRETGTYFIQPASIETDNGPLETLPLEINVVPNPDGIIQTPPKPGDRMGDPAPFRFREQELFRFPDGEFRQERPRKKRKVYKI